MNRAFIHMLLTLNQGCANVYVVCERIQMIVNLDAYG